MTRFEGVTPILRVRDLAASLEHYDRWVQAPEGGWSRVERG